MSKKMKVDVEVLENLQNTTCDLCDTVDSVIRKNGCTFGADLLAYKPVKVAITASDVEDIKELAVAVMALVNLMEPAEELPEIPVDSRTRSCTMSCGKNC